MYIEQGFRGKNEWWRYLLGFLATFFVSQLGAIPLIMAVAFKVMSDGGSFESISDQ